MNLLISPIMNEQSSEINSKDTGLVIIAIVAPIAIVGLWLINLFTLKDLSVQCRGTYGDMFGAVNALFSGLAFAGIILTILLQRKELSLQREELKETRKELKRTADAQEKSEEALRKQAENLKISAKLSALNSLLSYYTDTLAKMGPYQERSNIIDKINDYVKRIETILEIKEHLN